MKETMIIEKNKALENDIRLLQNKIMILKEIVATYEIDKSNEYKFIEDLKRILWDKDEGKDLLNILQGEEK